MKKILFPLAIAIALMLLTATVVFADQPPNIAPAERYESYTYGWSLSVDGERVAGYYCDSEFRYSNDANGNATFKCKGTLYWGTPQYEVFEEYPVTFGICSPGVGKFSNFEFDGEKMSVVIQCSGLWSP